MFIKKMFRVLKIILNFIISLILILLQILLYRFLFFDLGHLPHMSLISSVVSVFLAIYIIQTDVNPSYKTSWILIVLIFPFSGSMFYLLFGRGNTLPTRKHNKISGYIKENIDEDQIDFNGLKKFDNASYKNVKILKNNTNFPIYENTKSEYFKDGDLFFKSMLNDLENANEFIFMEYFIIGKGIMWNKIKEILIKKASVGVEVKIIYDAIGSTGVLDSKEVKYLNEFDNIEMVPYSPMGVKFNLSANYRDHRKILVIDGVISYTGGINIADEYIHLKDRFGFFRDNGMKLTGKATYSYTLLFVQNWYMSTKKKLDIKKYKKDVYEESDGYVLPFGDGPLYKTNSSYILVKSIFENASDYVYLSTPYFIIDHEFIDSICRAIKSGIDVRLLVPRIPDKKLIFILTRSHYAKILKAGGRIYEYTPGFNHAKNIISDDKCGFIGTVNMDYRSLFLHFECGNFLVGTSSLLKMKSDFLDACNMSEEITYEKWEKRPLYIKIVAFFINIFGPLL